MSGIIRTQRAPSTFFQARKAPFLDERLSFGARGLLAYLFTKPDDWETRNYDLVNASPGGKAALQTILTELKQYGYIARKPKHKADGTLDGWDTVIFEDPAENTDFTDIPVSGKTENPNDGKPERRKTGIYTKNDFTNNDITKKEKREGAKNAPPPTRQSKAAQIPKPAAVHVYREIAHLYPHQSQYEIMDKAIGADQQSLARWGETVTAWCGCGWNPKNVKGMLDFYQRGEMPGTQKPTNGTAPAPPKLSEQQMAIYQQLQGAVA